MSEKHCYHKLKELKVHINNLNNQINEILNSCKLDHKIDHKDHKNNHKIEEEKKFYEHKLKRDMGSLYKFRK